MKKKSIISLCLLILLNFTGCSAETTQNLKEAGLNTLLGMCTVFMVLILISWLISLFKYIPKIEAFFKKDKKEEKAEAKAEVSLEEEYVDDLELVAVISAAVAAYSGSSTDDFVVRSIRRR